MQVLLFAGSGWLFLTFLMVVGRQVVRTQPVMYALFGQGRWFYPGEYAVCVACTVVMGAVCLWGAYRSARTRLPA